MVPTLHVYPNLLFVPDISPIARFTSECYIVSNHRQICSCPGSSLGICSLYECGNRLIISIQYRLPSQCEGAYVFCRIVQHFNTIAIMCWMATVSLYEGEWGTPALGSAHASAHAPHFCCIVHLPFCCTYSFTFSFHKLYPSFTIAKILMNSCCFLGLKQKLNGFVTTWCAHPALGSAHVQSWHSMHSITQLHSIAPSLV